MRDSDSSTPSLGEMLRGVIFDMDGTLVSTLSLIVYCVTEVVEKYLGRTLTFEEVIATFGPPAREIVRRFTSPLREAESEAAIEYYYACYKRELPKRAILFPGIKELLEKLRNSGRRLGIFTGVERVMMNMTLDCFGLEKYFHVLVAVDDIRKTKPDPEGVELALNKMGLGPKESIMVGDSPSDILAGKGAGVLTAAALWSPQTRGDPTRESPDFQFRSVGELSRFFFPVKRNEEPGFYFSPNSDR